MTEKIAVVRDFIYIDLALVCSFYSQIFQGYTENIVQSFQNGVNRNSTQTGPLLSGQSADEQVAEISQKTERKVLADYLYTSIEEKLSSKIVDCKSLAKADYMQKLEGAVLIKVSGCAEVFDYLRMGTLIENFNQMGESIFTLTTAKELPTEIALTEARLQAAKGQDKKELQQKLALLKNPKEMAKRANLAQDPQLLNGLGMFIKLFFADALDFIINSGSSDISFRGVLDRNCLRIPPARIRALYGDKIDFPLTMVGQVTKMPKPDQENAAPKENPLSTQEADKPKSPRDAFEFISKHARVFETLFHESKKRTEVFVQPLAIYRELTLPVPIADKA
ncbi:MAG: hypothetical protein BWY69_00071 [Planctomycetes bacterium ADurb.Bin401]|nr:MAG: hypothetical protein BWY69_00071 [Planctomycetes bacterium ADurb.Bin401]